MATREQLIAYARGAATRAGIDPDLFIRQMAQESINFDPDVVSGRRVSSAGAQGVAQFMPDTAKGLGINPLDPAAALDAAAGLMAQYIQQYGSWELALAAYNAGPGAVAEYGGVPPYEETQRYIQAVTGGNAGGGNVVVPRYGPGETVAGAGAGGELTDAERQQVEDEAAAAAAEGMPTGPSSSGAPYASPQWWSDYGRMAEGKAKEAEALEAKGEYPVPDSKHWRAEEKKYATGYRLALKAEGQAGTSTAGGMSSQAFTAQQNAASRQTQLDIARMSDQIRRGELQVQQAMNIFTAGLQNQRAAMEASKWAIGPNQQWFPQFGPGESMATSSKILGSKFSPIDVQRMRYEPVQLPSPIDFSAYGQQPGGQPSSAGVQQPPPNYWTDPTVTGEPGPGYTPQWGGPLFGNEYQVSDSMGLPSPSPSPYGGNEPWGNQAMYAPAPGPAAPASPYGAGESWGNQPMYGIPSPAAPAAPAEPGVVATIVRPFANIPTYFESAFGSARNAGNAIVNALGQVWDAATQSWR